MKPITIVSPEEYKKAEREINEEMEKFSADHRIYMQQCREAAKHCVLGK